MSRKTKRHTKAVHQLLKRDEYGKSLLRAAKKVHRNATDDAQAHGTWGRQPLIRLLLDLRGSRLKVSLRREIFWAVCHSLQPLGCYDDGKGYDAETMFWKLGSGRDDPLGIWVRFSQWSDGHHAALLQPLTREAINVALAGSADLTPDRNPGYAISELTSPGNSLPAAREMAYLPLQGSFEWLNCTERFTFTDDALCIAQSRTFSSAECSGLEFFKKVPATGDLTSVQEHNAEQIGRLHICLGDDCGVDIIGQLLGKNPLSAHDRELLYALVNSGVDLSQAWDAL